jgi:hypothetical protein
MRSKLSSSLYDGDAIRNGDDANSIFWEVNFQITFTSKIRRWNIFLQIPYFKQKFCQIFFYLSLSLSLCFFSCYETIFLNFNVT